MADYRRLYPTDKEKIDRIKAVEKQNAILAGQLAAESSKINEFEMQITGWTLKFDRDSCKVVKQK